MAGKRLSFWLGVAGVSLLANFALELAADHIHSPGFQQLKAFTHRGPA